MADTRIDDLRRRLERDPGSRIFAQLAEELRKSGDLGEAIGVARAGLAVHPSYPSARLTLGRALLDSGDATGARAELDSALRDAPDNILASRYLAQAREQLGDLKGAAEQYRKTLVMAPDDRQLQGALAALESRLSAPAGDAAPAAETTPPVTRGAPPPLPPSALARGEGQLTPGKVASGPGSPDAAPAPGLRAGAPPLVFAPSRPAAAPAPEPIDEASPEGGALAPTLRIHASQGIAPAPVQAAAAPPPPAPPPPAPAPPPAPPAALAPEAPVAFDAPAAFDAPVAFDAPEPRTLPGGPALAAAGDAPPDSPSGSTTPFSSSTLAELYFQQGLVDRAAEVYRQLLEQDPENDKARQRLAELERTAPASDERAVRRRALERTIAGLETLLGAVRRR